MSHFRAATLSWDQISLYQFQFNMQQSWRRSYFGNVTVGQVVNVGNLFFGDGTNISLYAKVLSVNAAEDYFVGEAVTSAGAPIVKTYASAGNYEAYFESNARLSTLSNYSDTNFRAETIINAGILNEAPVSSLPPIVQVADNAIFTLQIPAIDPDGDAITYRIGRYDEFITGNTVNATNVAPAGVTVSSTGLLTWDVRDSVAPGVAVGQRWVMTLMIEDGKTKTPVDFILQIVDAASNQAPTFTHVPAAQTVKAGQTSSVAIEATDPNNNLVSIVALNPPAGMTTEFHASHGELHVDFAPTVPGTYVVTFLASDAGGLSAQTSITYTVTAANSDPVAADDTASTAENAALLLDVLANDSDGDSDALSITTAAINSGFGTVTIENGKIKYDPGTSYLDLNAGESRAVEIGYTVSDGKGGTDTAIATVTVNGLSTYAIRTFDNAQFGLPKMGIDSSGTYTAGSASTMLHVVDNDIVFDDQETSSGQTRDTSYQTLAADFGSATAGQVIQSIARWNVVNTTTGESGLGYIFAILNTTDPAAAPIVTGANVVGNLLRAFTIAVNPGDVVQFTNYTFVGQTPYAALYNNNDPVADDEAATTSEDSAILIDVLDGDSDVDASDTLSISATSVASGLGSVSIVDGKLRYDPSAYNYLAATETATVTLAYTVSDGRGGTDIGAATITVTGVNDSPTADDDAASTGEDSSVLIDVLTGDTDPDTSNTLSIAAASVTSGGGSVSVSGGQLRYDPGAAHQSLVAGQTATATIGYTVSDGQGGTDVGEVTVTINGANDAPDAANDNGNVVEDGATSGNVRGNDSIVDAGTSFALTGVAFGATAGTLGSAIQGQWGTLVLNADGSYSYAADADLLDTMSGVSGLTDVFTYEVTDNRGMRDTATLTINVALADDEVMTKGSNSNDIMNGDADRGGMEDTLNGGNNHDRLFGHDGADKLYGGNGNDHLEGGNGHDLLDGGNDLDTLLGGAGNDTLNGGSGNDRIDGGTGNDLLIGGVGNDLFVFGPDSGNDEIMDFRRGQDKIDLGAIDAKSGLANDQAFTWIGSAAFSGAGQLRSYSEGREWFLAGDINGDGVADFVIATGGVAIIASDIAVL